MIASLAPGQSWDHDCPGASEVSMDDMGGKLALIYYEFKIYNHNKTKQNGMHII